MTAPPTVSIGMPVHNGGPKFEKALRAVLGQTARDIEVIVSDNGSTDETADIARRHAENDPRVRYIRHDPAIGAFENFRFVLGRATAPYFMWAAADDRVAPGFVERAREILDARGDVVSVGSEVEFVHDDGTVERAPGSFALMGSARENVCRFMRAPVDNSRFYGLFRRVALDRAMPERTFYSADWAISLATLRDGKHARIPDVLLVRTANDPSRYMRMIDAYFPSRFGRLFALAPFTRHVLLQVRPPLSPRGLFNLLRLNVWIHVAYCRYRYPAYGRAMFRAGVALDNAVSRVSER